MDVSGAEAGWNMNTYLSINITQSFNYADYTRKQLVVATGERVVLVDLEVDFSENRYFETGYYESQEIDLSSLIDYGGSVVTETKTVPAGSVAKLEVSYHEDGVWGEYVEVTNQMIQNWVAGKEFNETSKIKYKITLTRASFYSAPVYSSLIIYIEEASGFTPIFIIRNYERILAEIYDYELNLIGECDDYELFSWKNYYQEPSSFKITIDSSKISSRNLLTARYVGITRNNETRLCQFLKNTKKTDRKTGTITYEAFGVGLERILNDRLILGNLVLGVRNIDSFSEDVIKTLVNENCALGASESRRFPRLLVANSKQRGTNISFVGNRNSSVYEAVIKILKSEGIGQKIIFDKVNKELIYDVYFGQELTVGSSFPVVFSMENQNIINLDYQFDKTGEKNLGYLVVEDELVEVGSNTGFDRKEIFITGGKNIEQHQALDYGRVVLEKYISSEFIDFEISEQGLYSIGRDFNLGDIVTVKLDSDYDKRISSEEIVITTKENNYKFEFGDKFNPIEIIDRKIQMLERGNNE